VPHCEGALKVRQIREVVTRNIGCRPFDEELTLPDQATDRISVSRIVREGADSSEVRCDATEPDGNRVAQIALAET
jgi:hypothetical protein